MNVSEFVWTRLQELGLNRVYGYPGDGIGGLDVALQKAMPGMEYVQVRHEEMAAFMASAHAKFTGGAGLCYATSGPGAIHLLNGLYDAKMDKQPVVAIVGQQARTALGASYQQEVDLVALFKDVASDYVAIGTVPGQVRPIGAAWEEALGADRPVVLEFYTDPNVPPLPPHISAKDALHFMTMMPDEPELGSVIKNSAKELLSSVLPGS